jgi:hypothetical protein
MLSSLKTKSWIGLVPIVPLLSCLLANSASAGLVDRKELDDTDPLTYRDSYSNPIFGYSVTIPGNLLGVGAVPIAPNHGISIALHDRVSSIGVDAEYNALDLASATEAAQMEVDYWKPITSKTKLKRETTRLCNIRAVHQTYEFEDLSGVRSVAEGVFAILPRKKYPDIVYEVTLWTVPSSLPEARLLFSQVLRSFKCMPPSG